METGINNPTNEQLLNAIQNRKARKIDSDFPRQTAKVRASILANRIPIEREDLLKLEGAYQRARNQQRQLMLGAKNAARL